MIHNAWCDLEKKSGLQPFSSPQQSDLDPQSAYQEENLIRQEVQRNLESFTDNKGAIQVAIETRITLDNDLFNTEKLTLAKQLAAGYQWFTGRAPIEAKCMPRYHSLIMAHERLGGKTPTFWRLDKDNKPQFELKYDVLIRNLQNKVEILRLTYSESHLARASMLLVIADYLKVISEHATTWDAVTGRYIRPDGVEAMFFGEMIDWFQRIVPNLRDNHPETTEIFAQRARYCREVFDLVTVHIKGTEAYANPKATLQRLTEQMEAYHTHLVQYQNTYTFNTLIQRLSDDLLSLSSKALNIIFLLIRGVNQPNLLVEQLLNPQPSDLKINHMLKTRLGEWLRLTLEKAGITKSTFASEKTLTIDDIKQHLSNEHPKDAHTALPTHLKNALDAAWGHWEFVTDKRAVKDEAGRNAPVSNPQLTQQAEDYLALIRTQCIDILKIHFIRQNLVRAALVVNVFGEIWIYGDPVGQAVLEELLTSVYDVSQSYHQHFDDFWKKYYQKHYTTRAKQLREDDISFPAHRWLNNIEQNNKPDIIHNVNAIAQTINEIRKQASHLPKTLEKIQQTKKALFTDMLSFMRLLDKTTSINYQIIKNALKNVEHSPLNGDQLNEAHHLSLEIQIKATEVYQRNKKITEETERAKANYISQQSEVIAAEQIHESERAAITTRVEQEKTRNREELIQHMQQKFTAEQQKQDTIAALQKKLELLELAVETQKAQSQKLISGLTQKYDDVSAQLSLDVRKQAPEKKVAAPETIPTATLLQVDANKRATKALREAFEHFKNESPMITGSSSAPKTPRW